MADSHKVITCILPKGGGLPALQNLRAHFGIVNANINNARGVGRLTPLRHRGVGEQPEKEILTVIVAKERAEEVFEFIYHDAHIDRPHGGIIYMAALTQATQFTLPELPEED
jgi:nitrogen regulatory protein PII